MILSPHETPPFVRRYIYYNIINWFFSILSFFIKSIKYFETKVRTTAPVSTEQSEWRDLYRSAYKGFGNCVVIILILNYLYKNLVCKVYQLKLDNRIVLNTIVTCKS